VDRLENLGSGLLISFRHYGLRANGLPAMIGQFKICCLGGQIMPTMSDRLRRRIVAKQRKVKNAAKRAAKAAKRERNSAR